MTLRKQRRKKIPCNPTIWKKITIYIWYGSFWAFPVLSPVWSWDAAVRFGHYPVHFSNVPSTRYCQLFYFVVVPLSGTSPLRFLPELSLLHYGSLISNAAEEILLITLPSHPPIPGHPVTLLYLTFFVTLLSWWLKW